MSVQKQIEQLLSHRAAEWLELMSSGEATPEDNQAFVAWVCESPRHMEEILKHIGISHEVRRALQGRELDQAALLQSLTPNVTPLVPRERPEPVAQTPPRKRTWWKPLVAACVVLGLVGVFAQWQHVRGKSYSTAIGEQRTVELSDGSVVYLNGKSRIVARLGRATRDIDLEGEGLFRVAHDAGRPFRVHTRDAVVQALGTQFNVDTHVGGTRVAVLEGVVQVTTSGTAASQQSANARVSAPPTKLKAGEAARVSRAGDIERRSAGEAAGAATWRQRQLVFEGMPLEEAVEEFNRYRKSMQLRLEGVRLGSHHYSGTFDADDPESFADLLARERDLTVEKHENEIIIRPR
jgi:transmembrane sensor